MIKLTYNSGDDVYVNTDKIMMIYVDEEGPVENDGCTTVEFENNWILVRETPEEILQKIKEAKR